MEFEDAVPFLRSNHRAVVTTFRRNGAAHSSIVVCGAYQGNMALVAVRGNSVKVRNLRRDPRCTVAATSADWRSCVVVEGQAQLIDYHNTDAEEVRQKLREVFRACGDSDHPDWEGYDRAMRQQDAVIVLVKPERVYGRVR
jgi:PPOX class probable F420-dependent enzyme